MIVLQSAHFAVQQLRVTPLPDSQFSPDKRRSWPKIWQRIDWRCCRDPISPPCNVKDAFYQCMVANDQRHASINVNVSRDWSTIDLRVLTSHVWGVISNSGKNTSVNFCMGVCQTLIRVCAKFHGGILPGIWDMTSNVRCQNTLRLNQSRDTFTLINACLCSLATMHW